MQGIVQEACALLLRRQLGGECLAEFMQIFGVMCSSPYQNFGDWANVFGEAVFDSLEHTRIPRRRRSRVPGLCRGVSLSAGILSQSLYWFRLSRTRHCRTCGFVPPWPLNFSLPDREFGWLTSWRGGGSVRRPRHRRLCGPAARRDVFRPTRVTTRWRLVGGLRTAILLDEQAVQQHR